MEDVKSLFRRTPPPSPPATEQSERTPGRPPGTYGDTGLAFTGWYRAASDTLTFASRDDDPRCVLVLCTEADVANRFAADFASNERQSAMTEVLSLGIQKVKKIAEETPPLEVPHQHDPREML